MSNRPNILMICSDQHTARVMGAYDNSIIRTPNLDRLADEGTRFDSTYCNCPVCVPSRASFMTGRYPFHCEVLDNGHVLDSRYPTLAHIAVRAGYHSVLSGKMHFLGPDQRHGYLERLVGELGAHGTHGVRGNDARRPCGDLPTEFLGNCSRPEPLQFTGAGGNALVDYDGDVVESAVEWLHKYARHEGEKPPFFLTAGFLLPHCPYIAPQDIYDQYADKVPAPWLSADVLAALHPCHRAYRDWIDLDAIPAENLHRAAIAYYALTDILDQNVGRLIDALQQNGLWENTIVIYFSDHGEMLGRHGRWHKDTFFEDAARVPLVVRHPTQKTQQVIRKPVSLVDLMPTLCEWLDVPCPPGADGESLVPLLSGKEGVNHSPVKVESYSFWEGEPWSSTANRMVRKGRWKLSYYSFTDSYELYDLDTDPEEERNLSTSPEHKHVVDELSPLLFDDGWSPGVPAQINGKLNAIGYRENVKALQQSRFDDPFTINVPDLWPGTDTANTWLDKSMK